ncbi:uncharacterized protein LOC126678394 [Mercurialis annua]|uniref:uncharacterized protein LOC126678394 n=1 Tax=Mercurialis annua TaxID=3986 RepID=UPI00215F5F2F|nr:uncharacterized protein LOC126678394 [Mercurialis annua]
MGQSLIKFSQGNEENKENEIECAIEEWYNKVFIDTEQWELADFYRAVCQIIEEINKKLKSTQFRTPDAEKLKQVYQIHCKDKGKAVTKEEFQKMLQEVIIKTGFTGFGSKDIFIFLFGVPAAALFLKQRIAPKAVPNDVFIPIVTSATVYFLARLNKI